MSKTNNPIITPSVSLSIWLSFFVLTLTWGSSFILVKRGMEAYSPWQVASLRLVAAFLSVSILGFRNFKYIAKDKLPFVFLSSLLTMFFPAYLFCIAQLGVSSSVVGVMNALTPMFTFIIGIVFFKQKAKNLQIVGLAIGFIGSAMLILMNKAGQFSLNFYAFFVVLATMLYGLNTNIIKRYLNDVNPIHYSTVAISMAGILASFYLFSTNWVEIYQTAPNGKTAFWAVVTLGVMGTAFSQIIFNKMLQNTTAVFASSITYFIPIVAVLWGVFDGEVLTMWHYLGMLCIICGIWIVNKTR